MNDKVNNYFNSNTNCYYHHNNRQNPPSLFPLPNTFLPANFLQFTPSNNNNNNNNNNNKSSSHLDHLPTCPRHHFKNYYQPLPPPPPPSMQTPNLSKYPDPLTHRFHCNFQNCEKHYKRIEHLKRHIKSTHLLKTPYICPILNCEKKFTRKDNMKQHIKRHGNKQ